MLSSFPRSILLSSITFCLAACSVISGQKAISDTFPTATPAVLIDPGLSNPAPSLRHTLTIPPTDIPATQPVLSPSPSPNPMPRLIQLTANGCCVEPFWSPDGKQVLFLDKPSPDSPAGFWGIGSQGGEPSLYTDRLGLYSADMSLMAYPENGQTVVERLSDGQRWTIPNEGRAISFSPDGALVVWTAGNSGPPFDSPLRQVWVSAYDGTQPRQVAQVVGGGFSGWFPDGRMLVNGKYDASEPFPSLWAVSLLDGGTTQLATGERLRGISLSPGGSWLAYQKVFDPDPALNGIWLVNAISGETRRLALFGGYRWQDDQHLLVIPLDTTQPNHQLWQIEASTGATTALTDPALLPFKVANGDWSISPDGKAVVFVSAVDRNIWMLDLQP